MMRERPHPPARSHPPAPSNAAGLAARRAAFDILLRVERDRAFADVLLGRRVAAFAPPDRRLITQLVLGTLAWQGRLDYELARVSSRAPATLALEVLTVLRMGLYQLRLLTRIPAHAAVDTAVTLARESAGVPSTRFVNAVLRNALRAGPPPMPSRERDEIEYLAVSGSHPRWMVEKLVEWFGIAAAEALIAANNEAAPNSVRLNLSRGAPDDLIGRLERDGMRVAARGPCPEIVILDGAPIFDSAPFREGLFTLQSVPSQIVARMLDPRLGAIVVDCAAAPGGKSTHLAEMVGERGRVIAIDLNFAGLKNSRALAARLRHRNIRLVRADSSAALPLREGSVDYVLLDAPCTGLGTLREHPELRWRLAPHDAARMAALQGQMLERAAALLRPGGVLVYAVCSLAPEEGPEVVKRFLARNQMFECVTLPPGSFGGAITSDGSMRSRPDSSRSDGFFAVRILRRCQ
jgi:16S rRNA (cytosine967-C5)-methyltransferase